MSTNIPFTLVEGAVALPPLRPLGPLSQAHGREWALLPPNISLRVELKALYAAMLRTFCLSSQAIRSMCSWEPLTAQAEAGSAAAIAMTADALSQQESAAAAAQASSQTVGAAGAFAAAAVTAAAASASAGVRPVARAPHRTSNLKLGSAVAIGGAAMLAWIVLDHPHREHANDAAPAANPPTSSRVAQQAEPSKTVTVASGNQKSDAKPDNKSSVDLNTATHSEARVTQAATVQNQEPLAASPATRTSVAPVAAKPPEIASRDAAPVTARRSSNTSATSTAIAAAPTWTARHAASSAASTVSRSASTQAKPSAAGEYSPFAPSASVDSEYESMTTSARTYSTYGTTTANAATPQRAQTAQRSNADANDSSWMGRMSQRRVTEVPELFSR
ncbi:hypothetical protein KZJ38_06325 [Paraburkholderia edwinii]|uniref:Uncharacterized protein n=1 Tax=Paraburkholderia edwinii TaxID=2861782 RepID=A0ABX8ULN7_9BURK|nr:hypothetical protein [Paraburkholderia edwinii]QYD69945.1 hypothetical protein KZJ38_06325 [Paraburkholderia edwinii]